MYFYGMDYTYLIFVLPAVVLGILAQTWVKSSFSKYNSVKSGRNISGAQAAQFLLKKNDISDVKIAHISGNLTDNYNPANKILSLSDSTFQSNSIAAIGVAAHETGHAIQHATEYFPLKFRRTLVPVANFGSRFGPLLVIAGYILGANAYSSANAGAENSILSMGNIGLFQLLTYIGLILYAGAVLFALVTLPVEFNASRRALKILEETNVLDETELRGVRKVLSAAAMTYVASALTAVGNLLRIFVLTQRRNNRR